MSLYSLCVLKYEVRQGIDSLFLFTMAGETVDQHYFYTFLINKLWKIPNHIWLAH